METKIRGRRVRPEDYDGLVEFYQSIITNKSASLRMRLTAAKQLDAILTRMERRQDTEARRAEREAARATRERGEASERKTHPTFGEIASQEAEKRRDAAVRRGVENLKDLLKKS